MSYQNEDKRMAKGNTVEVRDNFEKAIRKFKKKVQDSGILNDLRERESYEKPTTRRKRLKNIAKRRWKKLLASQTLPPKLY